MKFLFTLIVAVNVVNHSRQDIFHNRADGDFVTWVVITEFNDQATVNDAAALQYRATAAPR